MGERARCAGTRQRLGPVVVWTGLGLVLSWGIAFSTALGIQAASAAGEVSFPHRLHYEDFGIECGDCHHETDATALSIPHREYYADLWVKCETCHRGAESTGEPQACGNCHHESPASIADETLSSKVVIHQSCWGCHDVGVGAEASSSCASCHALPDSDRTIGDNHG